MNCFLSHCIFLYLQQGKYKNNLNAPNRTTFSTRNNILWRFWLWQNFWTKNDVQSHREITLVNKVKPIHLSLCSESKIKPSKINNIRYSYICMYLCISINFFMCFNFFEKFKLRFIQFDFFIEGTPVHFAGFPVGQYGTGWVRRWYGRRHEREIRER